jgi:hypothetical protein
MADGTQHSQFLQSFVSTWPHHLACDPGDACLHMLLQVLATLGSVQGKRVLELGAGIGRFTGELAKTGRLILPDCLGSCVQFSGCMGALAAVKASPVP